MDWLASGNVASQPAGKLCDASGHIGMQRAAERTGIASSSKTMLCGKPARWNTTAAISTAATRFAFRRAWQQMQHHAACSAVLKLWSRTSVVGPCDGLAGLNGDGVRVEDQGAGVRAELHVSGVRRQGQAEGGDGHACSSKNNDTYLVSEHLRTLCLEGSRSWLKGATKGVLWHGAVTACDEARRSDGAHAAAIVTLVHDWFPDL